MQYGALDFASLKVVSDSIKEILTDNNLKRRFRLSPEGLIEEKVKDLAPDQQLKAAAEIQKVVRSVIPGIDISEAKNILNESLHSPKYVYNIFVWLNVTLFLIGITLFILAVVTGIVRGEEQFTIIFGVGGLATLLSVMITNPLKRISNAASDQSQLRTIVIGFWVQLSNITNQIERVEFLPDEDKIKTIKELNTELNHAMKNATDLLQKNVEMKIKDINPENERIIKALQKRIETLEKNQGATTP